MKIKELMIEGLFDEYDFHWKLNANTTHDVNILAGRNGSFKSTILDIIYTYIKETQSINKFKDISSLSISFTESYKYTYLRKNEEFNITSGASVTGENTISIPVHDYLATKDHIKIKNDDFRDLVLIDKIATFDRMANGNLLDLKLDKLVSGYGHYLYNLSVEITKTIQKENKIDFNRLNEINKAKDLFVKIINDSFAHSGKKINEKSNELEFITSKEKKIGVKQLSSGEKQYLIIMLTVLLEVNKEYILLMDEPEISLNIEWQETLLENIEKLNPNCQIIMTTHSPGILLNGWGQMVTEMDKITICK
ncbi:ABC transporter ATP-binding protein [Prevotella herbatica]|uniref:ABC transporter ATP-binding protein n=1 Tax=Prevotella herbatica TaxID=2801997 RepID=A0ABM7NZB1_9BACT|nr:AAA family ATPase [Prevotella herbatica]BCS85754.1 ABC transporter ATP-binding protein [Prevotella herbatica]